MVSFYKFCIRNQIYYFDSSFVLVKKFEGGGFVFKWFSFFTTKGIFNKLAYVCGS
jgi:hypothetical protein